MYFNDGAGRFSTQPDALPAMLTSGSSVAVADSDGDGDLDVFVGGRLVPGRYPEAPRSYLLRNEGDGMFTDVTATYGPALRAPGMVTDAVWTDVNQDQRPDLVIVGEWMKVRVFLNEADHLTEAHPEGLVNTYGWWNTVVAHDLDQDGDPDLMAGNVGMNNPFRATVEQPVTLLYADFDQNGSIDPLLNYYVDSTQVVAFSRDELIGQMVSLRKTLPDYASYARAGIPELLTPEQRARADTLRATLFESVYMTNEGGEFSVRSLPVQAQFAPVYSILPTDINGDTYPDLVMGGNLARTRVSTGKYDANYGMVFLGSPDSLFSWVPPAQTGIHVRGDVRHITRVEKRLLFARNDDSLAVFSHQGFSTHEGD